MTPSPPPSALDPGEPARRGAALAPFGIAVALFAFVLVLSLLLRDLLGSNVLLIFLTAVAFAAWLAGFGPAVVASVLSLLAIDLLFIPPIGTLRIDYAQDVVRLVFFVLVAALISSVTQRLRTARALAESKAVQEQGVRAELTTVLEHLPAGVWIADETGRIIYGNPAGRRIWGGAAFVEPERYGEYRAWWLDSGRRITSDEWALARVFRTRRPILDEEIEIEAFDGSRKVINNSAVPILGPDGEFRGAVAVNEDITQRTQVERSLRHTTERLDAIIRAAPLAILALDLKGRVEAWNPAAERMFGWTAAEVVGRPTPIVPVERRREIEREFELAARGDVITGLETERLRKDGSRIDVRISTAPVRGADGELRGVMAVFEDITERLRFERERRRLTAILEAAPDFVATADPSLRVRYINRAGRRMVGLAEDADVSGLRVPDFYPDRVAGRILREAIPAAIESGTWSGETTFRDREGREIPVLEAIIAHRAPDGGLEYLSTIVRDISERKRAEETLRFLAEAGRILASSLEYEETLRAVARLAVPAIAEGCAVDVLQDGRVARLAVAHVDPDKEELARRSARRWPPDLESVTIEARALRTGEPALIPDVTEPILRNLARDEEHFHALRALDLRSAIIVPMRARGRTLGAIVLTAGRSRRRFDGADMAVAEELAARAAFAVDNARLYREARESRAEAERRAREEAMLRGQLERVMESRARLARGFSHDVKNPLGAADGHLQLLEEGIVNGLTPRQRESVGRARGSIEAALHLIDDLVELARTEAGRIEIERRPVDLGDLVREAAEDFRAPAEAKGLSLEVRIAGDIPETETDATRVRQILDNLLSNATKYTEEGGITLRVAVREWPGAPGPGRWVAVGVSDSGPGIPEAEQRRLFEEFVRLEPGTRRGAGLGLAISQRLAGLLGGRLAVESAPGQGSTFTLWLPSPPGAAPRRLEATRRPG